MSRKDKLKSRLLERPRNFTWDEACTLMKQCGFEQKMGSGSARMFVHVNTRHKLRLHEPHPQKTLLPYMLELLIESLKEVGEVDK